MPRPIEDKLGVDEVVLVQKWDGFEHAWKTLGPHLNGQGETQLHYIGCAYLTGAYRRREARVSPAQGNHGLRRIIRMIDRGLSAGATQDQLGDAYALSRDVPGDAGWRLFSAMERHGRRLSVGARYDPYSYPPSVLRKMLVESIAPRRGGELNPDFNHAALQLARLWREATGKKATISSTTKTEPYGPPRSAFGRFALSVFKALDPTIGFTAVTTACRNAVAQASASARGT